MKQPLNTARQLPRLTFILTLLFLTVGCDQATKLIARDKLSVIGPMSFLGDSVRLQHAQNPGAFLSFGSQLSDSARFWIFTVAVIGIVGATAFSLFRDKKMPFATTIALTMIVAGGIGNLIDRIIFGSVTDFVVLGIGPLRTGIFNIADVAILFGVLSLMLLPKLHAPRPEQSAVTQSSSDTN